MQPEQTDPGVEIPAETPADDAVAADAEAQDADGAEDDDAADAEDGDGETHVNFAGQVLDGPAPDADEATE